MSGNPSRLSGRTALVTGAARNIGRAIAAQGADLVVHYHSDASSARETINWLESAGAQAISVQADLRDSAAVARVFDAAEQCSGGLDIIVANAGLDSPMCAIVDMSDDELDRVLTANTRSTFLVLREAARRVRDNGRIVTISSSSTQDPGAGFRCLRHIQGRPTRGDPGSRQRTRGTRHHRERGAFWCYRRRLS